MVEMKMGQKDVNLSDAFPFAAGPEPPDASAGVENDERAGSRPQFNARCIASIAHGLGAGAGDRSSAAPDGRAHSRLP
jgi:hypothetical protein